MNTETATRKISQKKRRVILDAAHFNFSQLGFSKVTMDEIAASAGMAKASLYYYFPAKEEIFEAVVAESNDAFVAEMEILLHDRSTAAEKLRAYVQRRFEHHLEIRHLNVSEQKESEKLGPMLNLAFKKFSTKEISIIQRIVEQGNDAEEFAVEHPGKVAEAFIHMIAGVRIRHHKWMGLEKSTDPHYNDLRKEIVLLTNLLIRGLSA